MYKTFIVRYKDTFNQEARYSEVEAFDEKEALKEFWKFKTILELKSFVITAVFEVVKITSLEFERRTK